MDAFKVGLMAIATLISIGLMSLKITSNQSGFGDYIPYRTIVKDASGIFPKTPIKVAGISAGRIQKIELQGNTALITFEVLDKVKVTVGSKLKVKTVGFLGDKYLEIAINEASDQDIESMGLIESDLGAGFDALAKDASEALREIKAVAEELRNDLAPADGSRPVKQILDDTGAMVANAREISETLRHIFVDNQEKFNQAADDIAFFTEQLRKQVDQTKDDSLMAEARQVMKNLSKLTDDLRVVANNIKNGKGTVGKLLSEDQIADEVRETLSSVKKIVKKADTIRTELSLNTGLNTEYGGETGLGLRIFPAPERFYHLGLLTSEFGQEKEREITTTVNGGVSRTENRKVREKNSYRLNIQLGRKIQNFAFRGGLIDSTGGLGVDYERPEWGTKFLVETFDYGQANNFNLRLGTEIHLWNVFYGKVSGEDLINKQRSYTFSMGIRFLDEDLKGLIGFMF
ncbi:MAG: hypothetical protein A2504_16150 [Bdellovibrionales bacterium RIFOXYD12_FULL_39_22]|nr:MAG: hypothetical protein A2385_08060 [Bdellovibrionales bacterium RIFOXYB1_FULL_39_21]OFZ42988.1 MAG: hypothetical protein A2485_11165 [Bdellovibrionales bacterium RIFOXYC12_FULL_39_17]OFZ50926.1 MAG: hypothetical protein A2404_06975 [Bdellovibrionales bacterium RIFOXYC1_FULL_39_130]OFZ74069.1 MAG: hypothetical protein A2451_12195 [Bdellovibrionales bacterium RIFOXYC2_FULL_39_8]OFZ78149.1 MAG: hypothetical protein A2560_02145 [Bdellovibrionales bacterium RIFOXYD1_FULL_39_84]OFZ94017.1 MAG: